MAHVLVIGGDSAIGAASASALCRAGHIVDVTTRRADDGRIHLDLQDSSTFDSLPDSEAAIVCAAVARLKDCAENPASSRHTNVEGTLQLIETLRARGVRCLFLSTNQVLSGDKPHERADATRNPSTEYGRQKADAEAGVLAAGGAVLRFAKVVDPAKGIFADWAASLRAGQQIEAFGDMTLAPVLVDEAAHVITAWVRNGGEGIYQFSGADDVTYHGFATLLAEHLGCSTRLVHGVSEQATGLLGGVKPPPFTSLDSSRCTIEFGIAAPSIATVIKHIVGQARAA